MTTEPATEPTPAELRDALATASLVISSFRWRLRDAGFPFREPPNVDRTLARIDALVYPDEIKKRASQQSSALCNR